MELEAENPPPNRAWTPVVPVPSETVAGRDVPMEAVPHLAQGHHAATSRARPRSWSRARASPTASARCGTKSYRRAQGDLLPAQRAAVAAGNVPPRRPQLSTQLVAMKSHAVLDPVAAQFHLSYNTLCEQRSRERAARQRGHPHRGRRLVGVARAPRSMAARSRSRTSRPSPTPTRWPRRTSTARSATNNRSSASLTTQFNDLESSAQASATVANPNPAESPAELSSSRKIGSLNTQVATSAESPRRGHRRPAADSRTCSSSRSRTCSAARSRPSRCAPRSPARWPASCSRRSRSRSCSAAMLKRQPLDQLD